MLRQLISACLAVSFFTAANAFAASGAGSAGQVQVKSTPMSVEKGDPVWLEISGARGAGGGKAVIDGREFLLSASEDGTLTGFVGIDRDAKVGPHALEVYIADGTLLASTEVKVGERDFKDQHLNVDKKMVELCDEDCKRAEAEHKIIHAVLDSATPARLWGDGFTKPLKGRTSSTFGMRRYYNGTPGNYHGGIDVAASAGTPVAASADGTVALADDYFYTGNTVFIDHGQGLYTAYFHLSQLDVEKGQAVTTGQIVGKVGSTGRSTGPHLHWSVYIAGVKVDPFRFLEIAGPGLGGGETP